MTYEDGDGRRLLSAAARPLVPVAVFRLRISSIEIVIAMIQPDDSIKGLLPHGGATGVVADPASKELDKSRSKII